ncbi:MAG: aldolase/citrate lyase family protein [Acidobacteriota bacterium]
MAARQPVHVLYGGAHLFRADVCAKMSRLALRALEDGGMADLIPPDAFARVRAKLEREPVEDLRIDFEDGYGLRADDEEDGHAQTAAKAFAEAHRAGRLPPFIGIRLRNDWRRAERTLKIFLDGAGELPEGFVVTLAKVNAPGEVERLAAAAPGIAIEVMIETPDGLRGAREIVEAGPVVAAHFGPYDFTASLGVPASAQSLTHPLCDYARHTLLVALAGTGVRISDGPTSWLPIGAKEEVQAAWLMHMANVTHALKCGIRQGWDLHPAQLPARYAAVYQFYRENLEPSRERLRNYRAQSEQATRVGQAFDDAATVRGLESFFQHGVDCGALDSNEVPA